MEYFSYKQKSFEALYNIGLIERCEGGEWGLKKANMV